MPVNTAALQKYTEPLHEFEICFRSQSQYDFGLKANTNHQQYIHSAKYKYHTDYY